MANRIELQGPGFHKGVNRIIKENKRKEAEQRNAQTPLERTKAFRLNRNRIDEAPAVKGRKSRKERAADLIQAVEETESLLQEV